MTTEEAIEILKRVAASFRYAANTNTYNGRRNKTYWSDIYRKDAEALEMAIEALQGQKGDCDTCRYADENTMICNTCYVGYPNRYERAER